MVGKNQYQWERLGEIDPYWAVLSDHSKRGGNWPKDEFFATGEREILWLFDRLHMLGVQPRSSRALDFGCGVGRLSRALADRFEEVLGVDVSASMLEEAKRANSDKDNIRFIHNTAEELVGIPSGHIDLLYSSIVLQHIPSELQSRYIAEFCRVIAPGGIIVFQAPSHSDHRTWQGWIYSLLGNRLLNQMRRVLYGGGSGIMEIYPLSRASVERILNNGKTELISVDRDSHAGKAMVSFTYFAISTS